MMKGAFDRTEYSRIRLCKVMSMALNAFLPNIWDHVVTPSLFESNVFFPMKDPKLMSLDELKATLSYCKSFEEKVCSNTPLKFLNYLRFSEYVEFLAKPSDFSDALGVARGVSPYAKPTGEQKTLYGGKEPLPVSPLAEGESFGGISSEDFKARLDLIIKPTELQQTEGRTVDGPSSKPLEQVNEFMGRLETQFIVEREKMDFLLDLAALSWETLSRFRGPLEVLGFLLNDTSAAVYEAICEVVANRSPATMNRALLALSDILVYKRDKYALKTLTILVLDPEADPDPYLSAQALSTMTPDMARAVSLAQYPYQDLLYDFLRFTPM